MQQEVEERIKELEDKFQKITQNPEDKDRNMENIKGKSRIRIQNGEICHRSNNFPQEEIERLKKKKIFKNIMESTKEKNNLSVLINTSCHKV